MEPLNKEYEETNISGIYISDTPCHFDKKYYVPIWDTNYDNNKKYDDMHIYQCDLLKFKCVDGVMYHKFTSCDIYGNEKIDDFYSPWVKNVN